MHAMDRRMLVSVIIPTFNAETYLAETIGSVLDQDYAPVEVIIVDDGSTDGSIEVARRFGSRVKVLTGPHRGLAATRNRGMAMARGSCFMHLDSDDLLMPRAISILLHYLDGNRDMVTGRLTCFVSEDLARDVADRFVLPPGPQPGHLPGTSLVRADTFKKFGALDETHGIGADLEWWQRARDLGARVFLIDDVVLRRRIHGNNLSLRNRDLFAQSALKSVRAALQRKRASGAC
jgi:glycosyltransferase involved in cell wall biosynthesis